MPLPPLPVEVFFGNWSHVPATATQRLRDVADARRARAEAILTWADRHLPRDLWEVYFTLTIDENVRIDKAAHCIRCSLPTLRKRMREACHLIGEIFPDHGDILPAHLQHFAIDNSGHAPEDTSSGEPSPDTRSRCFNPGA